MGQIFKQVWAMTALALVLMVGQAKADVVVIDDFAEGVDLNIFLGGPSTAYDDGSHAGVLGNYRNTQIIPVAGFSRDSSFEVLYSPPTSWGTSAKTNGLKLQFGPLTISAYKAVYDNIGFFGSLNADLTDGANDRFSMTRYATLDMLLQISVGDTHGNSASVLKDLPQTVSTVTTEFFFTEFPGVDMTSVKSITTLWHHGGDFLFKDTYAIFGPLVATSAIPEPTSLSLLCLGSLALLRRSRKKRLTTS